jgi:uncharacterized membrane protein YccC
MTAVLLTALHDLAAFLASRDLWVNFLANLGGALIGVWLAFWVERRRSRRDADRLYGHMLVSARTELSYLRSMCVAVRDRLKAGGNATREAFSVAATKAVLISPMTHERAPYSLVMALTAVTAYAESTADSFREAVRVAEPLLSKEDEPAVAAAFIASRRSLETSADKLQGIIGIAIESMTTEITRLGIKVPPDPATNTIRGRIVEILTPRDRA